MNNEIIDAVTGVILMGGAVVLTILAIIVVSGLFHALIEKIGDKCL